MIFLRPLALLIFTVLFIGCMPEPRKTYDFYYAEVDAGWKPESVSLKCEARSCPSAVGAMVMVSAQKRRYGRNGMEIYRDIGRCSISLVKANQILTAGHCNPFSANEFESAYAYFINNGKTEVHRINRVLQTTVDKDDNNKSDIALLELASSSSIKPIAISRVYPTQLKSIETYVVNSDSASSVSALKIERKDCRISGETPLFPLKVSAMPTTVRGTCLLAKGNSGAAYFANGDLGKAEGVVHAGWDGIADSSQKISKQQSSLPHYGIFTAASCVDFPGHDPRQSNCLSVDIKILQENRRRLNIQYRVSFISEWLAARRSSPLLVFPLLLQAKKSFRLGSEAESDDSFYYLVPFPVCLRPNQGQLNNVTPLNAELYQENWGDWSRIDYVRTSEPAVAFSLRKDTLSRVTLSLPVPLSDYYRNRYGNDRRFEIDQSIAINSDFLRKLPMAIDLPTCTGNEETEILNTIKKK